MFVFILALFSPFGFGQVCVDSTLRIDINCECKRTNCAQMFDNDYARTLAITNKNLGNKLKPILDTQQNTNKVLNKLFRAEKVTAEEMIKVDQERAKLRTYNDRVLLAYNKFMVSKGKKPIDLKQESTLMERRFLASLPPSARKMYLDSLKAVDNAPVVKLSASAAKNNSIAESEDLDEPRDEVRKIEITESKNQNHDSTNNDSKDKGPTKVYSIESDIHSISDGSIFGVISKRYIRVMIDGYVKLPYVDTPEDKRRKEDIKKDIKHILKQI